MDGKSELADLKIAIIGLGLMGGSLALALRKHCKNILGIDQDQATLTKAQQTNAIDQASMGMDESLQSVDLVVLAVPVESILNLISMLPDFMSTGGIILDLGSTKRAIMGAYADLPKGFYAVGGHPMCGKAESGFAAAQKDLYHGAPFALVRGSRSSEFACRLVEILVGAVGAYPIWLDADDHDCWTAGISHLPYLLSCALVDATPQRFAPLIGPGFRSSTRLAATPLSMMKGVLKTNKDQVLVRMDQFLQSIQVFYDLLAAEDFERLFDLLTRCQEKQEVLSNLKELGAQ